MTAFQYNKADANPILPEGEYDAVIFRAETGQTKKGDPKLEIIIKIYDADGVRPMVTDNIVAPFGIRRLKQLCIAVGVDFDAGEVDPSEFVGKNVRVRISVRKDDTGQYDDQNTIRKYMPDETLSTEAATPPASGPAVSAPSTASPATSPTPAAEAATSEATTRVGKRDAWLGYCAAIRKDRPDVAEELLVQNWQDTCRAFFGDKPEEQYTDADWMKIRDEGPGKFIPF